jgi:hypothetical protein
MKQVPDERSTSGNHCYLNRGERLKETIGRVWDSDPKKETAALAN